MEPKTHEITTVEDLFKIWLSLDENTLFKDSNGKILISDRDGNRYGVIESIWGDPVSPVSNTWKHLHQRQRRH